MTFNTLKKNNLFLQAIGKFLLGVILVGRSVPSLLPALCRSFAGEHLLVTDHRGAGESEGYRHGPLWHCPASDVYGNHSPVPGDAAGACFALFFPYNAALHPAYCQARFWKKGWTVTMNTCRR